MKINNNKNIDRMLVFWSLNADLEIEEMINQMQDMSEKGITGLFLHARTGLKIPYMGEKWFTCIQAVLDHAVQFNMEIWLYDENGWPSGFADCLVPSKSTEYCQKILKYEWLKAGQNEPPNMVAAYVVNGAQFIQSSSIDVERLAFYYEINEYYTDILNPKAVDRFIQVTHERYKKRFKQYFGNVIKGIFTDEPQLVCMGHPWSHCLQESFHNEYGYDLLDNLPLLILDVFGYESFRHDFWKLISNLYTNNYVKTIYDWCEKNQLISTGHMPAEDSPLWQLSSVGSIMPNYKYFQMPGIDHLGNRAASPVLLKQVSSVAHQFGKSEILCECFGCSGWNTSFLDMEWMWGWFALSGVNVPCMHLSSYSIKGCRKRDYPPIFSYQEPWWDNMEVLVDNLRKTNTFLSEGVESTKIAVLHPQSSIWCEGVPKGNETMAAISNSFRILTENLMKLGLAFDYADEILLKSDGSVNEGKLQIGICKYDIFIVPPTISLENSTVELLKLFLESGGKLLFIERIPKLIDGRHQSQLIDWTSHKNASFCGNRVNILQKQGLEDKDTTVHILDNHNMKNHTGVYHRILKTKDGYRIFLWNSSRSDTVSLLVEHDLEYFVLNDDGIPVLSMEYPEKFTPVQMQPQTTRMFSLVKKENIDMISARSCYKSKMSFSIDNKWEISFNEPNAFTIDKAQYSIDGQKFCESMFILDVQQQIYEYALQSIEPFEVTVRYSFRFADGIIIPLTLAIELDDVNNLTINGFTIENDGWIIDKCIKTIKLDQNTLCSGLNTIDATYSIDKYNGRLECGEIFESLRNKFFFPIEIESIYLFGEFSLSIGNVEIQDMINYVKVNPDEFILDEPIRESKSICNVISDRKSWFYRGNIILENTFEIPTLYNQSTLLIEKIYGVGGSLSINGGKSLIICSGAQIDISEFVRPGLNTLRMEIWGSNRNLMGPHHQDFGEGGFVGPSLFTGKPGWEYNLLLDSPQANNVSDYSFVPQGLSCAPIITQKNKYIY